MTFSEKSRLSAKNTNGIARPIRSEKFWTKIRFVPESELVRGQIKPLDKHVLKDIPIRGGDFLTN